MQFFLLFMITILNLTFVNADDTKCNHLKNSNFENNSNNWTTYSSDTQLVDDAFEGNQAISIQDGGMDQITENITGNIDTYQFNGYYKTEGTPDGVWVGMNFYDKNRKLLLTKTVTLKATQSYQNFDVLATSTKETAYIQVRVWSDADSNGGSVILDSLKLSSSGCYDYVAPSSLPPKGIEISQAPQFVVIGFDDNTKSEGIYWALNLFNDKKNADGSEARVSFYMNSLGLDEWIEDDPQALLTAMQILKDSSHEIANHTYDHFKGKDAITIQNLDGQEWYDSIMDDSDILVDKVGVLTENIVGFRAPFLLYNQHMLNQLQSQGFLYDCSIEEGYASEYDGTNFRWPYQLNGGSPGHDESWYGNPSNPDYVEVGSIDGLWELPNHVLMVPKDSECEHYGIESGLWSRILTNIPYLSDFKITGFDYNLWSVARLNKEEVLGLFKYNLDLRLQGNRAPFMIGAHTQYYTDDWSETNAPNATTSQMREAISEFIEYALSKSEVRIRPAVDIVNWCTNPTPIN